MEEIKLDVSVRQTSGKGNLLGFASVKLNDCFVIDNIKVMNGSKGVFAAMPSVQKADGTYKDVCFPATKEFAARLQKAVVEGYVNTLTKEPVSKQIAENAQIAAAQTAPQRAKTAAKNTERG